jgi:hypothetical protein
MARSRYPDPWEATQKRIGELESELYQARHDIVDLMPREISRFLTSYYSCKSSKDYVNWQHDAVAHVISNAKPDPRISNPFDRAWCPLCKAGSTDPYERGLAYPEGLRRHLLGWGHGQRCPVIDAAFRNAGYSLREKLDEWKRTEKEDEANRRKTERLFLIDPRHPPLLIDESVFGLVRSHHDKFRPADEIPAAEQRLRELGFQFEVQGNVVAYKLMHVNRLVLADPRILGRLEFHVFSDEKPTKKTKHESFYLLDTWKADIPGKFRMRLTKACSTFPPSRDS